MAVSAINVATKIQGSDFLGAFGMGLMTAVDNNVKPLHTPGESIRPVDTLRKPIGAQGDITEAALKHLIDQDRNALIFDVEMSGGKTFMYLRVAQGLVESGWKKDGVYNVAIACPTTNVKKAIREIKKTVPRAKVHNLNSRNGLEVLMQNFDDKTPGVTFWVVGIARVRRHQSVVPYAMETKVDAHKALKVAERVAFRNGTKAEDELEEATVRCPKCGRRIYGKKSGKKEAVPLTMADIQRRGIVHCPNKAFPKAEKDSPYREKTCNAVLLTNLTEGEDANGNAKEHNLAKAYSIAAYLFKQMKGKMDLAILDEVQEARNDGIQGRTLGWLAQSAKKVIGATGTLLNGYPDSIWHLGWRLNPQAMRKAGFRHSELNKFIKTYGCTEERTVEITGPDGKKKTKKLNPRRLAGISAKIYPDILADWSIFAKLLEVFSEDDMPGYKEHLEPCQMSEPMWSTYREIQKKLQEEMGKARADGYSVFTSVVSRYLHVMLSWPDRLGKDIINATIQKRDPETKQITGERVIDIQVDELHLPFTPKEERLADIVADNVARGRKVLAYVQYTDERDCAERMRQRMELAGFRAAVLRSNFPSSEKREEYIHKIAPDIDVLICHPELVKLGLDLLEFPTIAFCQPCDDIITLRQAARRSWRLGQTEDVEIRFLYYEDTHQEDAMARISGKLDTTMLAEGISDDSEVFNLSNNREGSIIREMAKALEDSALGAKIQKVKAPPRINGGQEALLAQNVADVVNQGTFATEAQKESVAMVEAFFDSVDEVVEEKVEPKKPSLKVVKPKKTKSKADKSSEPQTLFVAKAVRKGRKVRFETEQKSAEDLESGAQLAMFEM